MSVDRSGPILAVELGSMLAFGGFIPPEAQDDPEGHDGGRTMEKVGYLAELLNVRVREWAASQPAVPTAQAREPREPNNDEVICPACSHQFRSIPVNTQCLLLDAGHEPPFLGTDKPTGGA